MFSVSLRAILTPKRNWRQCLCKILGWQTKSIMVCYGIFWSGQLEFIIRALTNSQGRTMYSHDRRSWLTTANTCFRSSFFVGWCTGGRNSAGFRWDWEFISECMKINKIRPKFLFFLQKIEIFLLISSFSTHIIAKLHFLLIGSTPLS